MRNTVVSLLLLVFLPSVPLAAEENARPFTLEPITRSFAVLGTASGVIAIGKTTACITAPKVELALHSAADKPRQLLGLRFGLGVPNGPDDWRFLAVSQVSPYKLTLTPGVASTVENAVGCFCRPDAGPEEYWLIMEMILDDPEHGHVATYSVTKKQFERLMKQHVE